MSENPTSTQLLFYDFTDGSYEIIDLDIMEAAAILAPRRREIIFVQVGQFTDGKSRIRIACRRMQ